jgi:MOSC domain-containing protein YiiM
MFDGKVIAIHIAPAAEAPMESVSEVRAVPGQGLEGDRYFQRQGTFWKPNPDVEVTLIESEAFDGLRRETNLDLDPSAGRRNIVTRGVPLNHLVDREFSIGEVRLRGLRLCEPCKHLQTISGKPGILGGLIHRGGLRAQILSPGMVKVGDFVSEPARE